MFKWGEKLSVIKIWMKIVVVLLLTKTTGDCKGDRMLLGTASTITHGISMSGPLWEIPNIHF